MFKGVKIAFQTLLMKSKKGGKKTKKKDVKNDQKLKNVSNGQEDIESLERDKQYQ